MTSSNETHNGLFHRLSRSKFYLSAVQRIISWAYLTDNNQYKKSLLADASAVIAFRHSILSTDDLEDLIVLDKNIHMLDNSTNIAILEELIKQRRETLINTARRH
ncbi:MAG: hypothetical protein KAG53_00915 [Endozoicomonadaceae bacterium]|nr:hypothetical protein [Endozoicomonadaceae bacterium]